MGNLGFGELLLIFLVVLLVFGASKVPQLGDALGRGIRNFKRSMSGDDAIDVTPKKIEEGPSQQPSTTDKSAQTAATPKK
ncbi:MAG TPA: twin-arginine translocase TatA/TatE family subunit [Myxococcales bacterium]|jgi:sec-independent protein translocase protein TatA|nr:twin-arginine translocase TatA/TatE family subunit [Myxococcales bacterium]